VNAYIPTLPTWFFGTANYIDSTLWLTELHRSKLVGLKGSMNVAYIHLMSTRYPILFVGAAKDQILSTTTIKMFNSHDAWRGDGAVDSNKQQSMLDLAL
jgi:hypothetical protein